MLELGLEGYLEVRSLKKDDREFQAEKVVKYSKLQTDAQHVFEFGYI